MLYIYIIIVKEKRREICLFMNAVTHVPQKYNWDCGVACVMMVINAQARADLNNHFKEICEEEGFEKSVWTIDLCYLLKRYNMNFLFCSTRLGVDPDFSKMTYYGSMLKTHTTRVEAKIACAKKMGIEMDERLRREGFTSNRGIGALISIDLLPVYLNNIIDHLNTGKPIIVLVNGNHLYCLECIPNKIKTIFLNLVTCGHPPYCGHYIVIIGYDINCKVIYYEDPLKENKTCKISFENFDKARTAYGTDEDIIFIF
ncbi:Protein GUCD1 [Nymphon striatum]|nr:Protein GUCD1 [Nymphon striatum]